jgi:hypothetical protein
LRGFAHDLARERRIEHEQGTHRHARREVRAIRVVMFHAVVCNGARGAPRERFNARSARDVGAHGARADEVAGQLFAAP